MNDAGLHISFNSTISALILLVLLLLELADRVGLKRDLEIAKDIQRMLLPEKPPTLPGLDIAFATKAPNPRNSVLARPARELA